MLARSAERYVRLLEIASRWVALKNHANDLSEEVGSGDTPLDPSGDGVGEGRQIVFHWARDLLNQLQGYDDQLAHCGAEEALQLIKPISIDCIN